MLLCLLKLTEKESFGIHDNHFLSSKHKILKILKQFAHTVGMYIWFVKSGKKVSK